MLFRQLFICLMLSSFLLTASKVNAQGGYPAPPSGVQWGWQGNVQFAFDSAKLRSNDKPLLNQLAELMLRYPQIQLLITGHTDNTGNLEHNRRLSSKRIAAVSTYLTARGVEPHRIHTNATGEGRPVSSNACPEDRERNRRADLAFFPAGNPPPVSRPASNESQPLPGECEQLKEELRDIR